MRRHDRILIVEKSLHLPSEVDRVPQLACGRDENSLGRLGEGNAFSFSGPPFAHL